MQHRRCFDWSTHELSRPSCWATGCCPNGFGWGSSVSSSCTWRPWPLELSSSRCTRFLWGSLLAQYFPFLPEHRRRVPRRSRDPAVLRGSARNSQDHPRHSNAPRPLGTVYCPGPTYPCFLANLVDPDKREHICSYQVRLNRAAFEMRAGRDPPIRHSRASGNPLVGGELS